MTIAIQVDLRIGLNTMDETGLPWAFLDEAPAPSVIVPGHHIVVGSGAAFVVVVATWVEGASTTVRPASDEAPDDALQILWWSITKAVTAAWPLR